MDLVTAFIDGWECSSGGRASTGMPPMQVRFPGAARDFSPSQLSVQTLLRCPYTPCTVACIYICVHIEDLIVHVKVRWIW